MTRNNPTLDKNTTKVGTIRPVDAGAATTPATETPSPTGDRPMATYVLVHGAFHTGQSWVRVVPRLAASGSRVLTPTLTGYGETRHLMSPEIDLQTHIDDVVRLLVDEDLHDTVLVGHSYAGMVISGVVNSVPERIARLVFLDAIVPEDGECAADVRPSCRVQVDAALASRSGWRIPPPCESPAPHGLYGVTDPSDLAWLRTTLSDGSVRCLQQSVRLDNPAAAAVPRTHIHCTATPENSTRRPVRPVQPNGGPAEVLELPAGHDCMITMPDALTSLLRNLT